MNYKEDIAINQYDLASEWLYHPGKFFKYQEESIKRDSDRLRMKEKIEVYEAELDSSIRAGFESEGMKYTEAKVKAEIQKDRKRQELMSELIQITEDYNILSAACKSFEHRKKSLEWLSQLFIAGYYAQPSEPRIKNEILDNISNKIKANLNKGAV